MVSSQLPRDWTPGGVRHMETIRDEFALMPQLGDVSLSYEIPDGNNGDASLVYTLREDSSKAISTDVLTTDEHFAAAYKIPLVAGNFFDDNNEAADSSKIVINETFARTS